METPKSIQVPAPNPASPALIKAPNPAPIEQLKALAEVRSAVPEWLTCVMQCNKRVEGDQEVVVTGCGHIICSEACLNKFREKNPGNEEKIKCPLCTLELKESALKNKMMIKEAFPFKPTKDNVTLICGVCVFDNEAVSYCSDCLSYLCEKCDELHPTIRLTQAHKVTKDLSERKEFGLDRLLSENSICKGHAGKPEPPPADAIVVTHNCCNCKCCKLRLCKLCAENHSRERHEVVDVGALRERLINKMKQTAELLAKVEIGMEKLEQKKIQMEDYWYPIFAELNSEFSVFVGKATKQYLDRKKDVSGLYVSTLDEIDRILKKLQIHGEQVDRYIEVTKSILDKGDYQSVLHIATRLSPLKTKLTEATNAFKDYDNFTLRRHKFHLGSTRSSDAVKLLEEFGKVNYTNPAHCPAFSLALDGSLTESARLTDDHGMDKTLEILKKAIKDLEEKGKKEGKEKAVKKATEKEATRPNAEEGAAKKATEATTKKPEKEVQKQMNGGVIQMEETNADLPNQERGEERKMGHGGNNMATNQEIWRRSESPFMIKFKRQNSPNLPAVIPRKSGRRTVAPSKFSI